MQSQGEAGRYKIRLMSELHRPDDTSRNASPSAGNARPSKMFSNKPAEGGGIPAMAWGVAGVVVLAAILFLLFVTRKPAAPPNTVQPLAAYASSLSLSQLAMSESTSLSGGKSTFIDGHIRNAGAQTVTSVTVQVLFHNDEQMPPQIETLPLSLIRTREPYIDTQPVNASPLKPGDERDFRLIFETIPSNWNTQMPEIHIIQVGSK